jgi:hypothetical protein
MRFFLPLFALVAAACAAEPNTLTPEEQKAGWKLLFDGKTNTGWKAIGKKEFPAKGWVVEDGALKRATAGGGDIVTTEDFDNFEFSWEWKIAPGGNSGVKYNLPDPTKNIGFEYQMLDDEKNADGATPGGSHRTASLYDLIPAPADKKAKPVGEWNESRIIVNGNKVEQWLNGAKTVETEMGSEELKALVAKSKYKNTAGFGLKKKGPILLQDHGAVVEFRSLKLRPL